MTPPAKSPVQLMAHMIAGFPEMAQSESIARALVDGGADCLEVQFPFTDPAADGPLIEQASQDALDAGFTVKDGFALMKRLSQKLPIPLFIMTYGSLVYARGAAMFCESAKESGVTGLIIPDMPPDYSEGLFEEGAKRGLAVVPVIAPGITEERLALIASLRPEYIYTALRLGITGSATNLDADTILYLDRVARTGAKIIAGFGVKSAAQMRALEGHAHAAAVGSHFLDCLRHGKDLTEAARELKQ